MASTNTKYITQQTNTNQIHHITSQTPTTFSSSLLFLLSCSVMDAVVADNSTDPTEHIRFRRSRNQQQPISPSPPNPPQISSLLQSTRRKPTISSIFLSTFTANNSSTNVSPPLKDKKKNFSSATFRGLGCATSSQVSAPAVIRSSADWQARKVRKKKQKKKNHPQTVAQATMNNPNTPVVVVPDVWCTPGIGFSAEAASIDCVVSRRPVQGRGRVEGDRANNRERSCTVRRSNNLENVSAVDFPFDFETTRNGSDVYGARHHRHFRHRSPGGFAEISMFQNSLLLGGRPDGYDRYRDLRLDVDNMSYEQLLELGDRIGCVSTGLREDEITRCLRKTKHANLDALPLHVLPNMERKCTICQEEYEVDDEMGKLDCGHCYHIYCIKQWLLRKNTCPVCKCLPAST